MVQCPKSVTSSCTEKVYLSSCIKTKSCKNKTLSFQESLHHVVSRIIQDLQQWRWITVISSQFLIASPVVKMKNTKCDKLVEKCIIKVWRAKTTAWKPLSRIYSMHRILLRLWRQKFLEPHNTSIHDLIMHDSHML